MIGTEDMQVLRKNWYNCDVNLCAPFSSSAGSRLSLGDDDGFIGGGHRRYIRTMGIYSTFMLNVSSSFYKIFIEVIIIIESLLDPPEFILKSTSSSLDQSYSICAAISI